MNLPVSTDIESLLAAELDAVLVTTPTSMHFEHAMAALRAGRHVMVDKPITLTAAEAVRLKHEADERGLLLSVFHNRRWDIDYLTVRAAVAGGVFGKVINVESRLGQWSSCVGPAAKEYRPQWRNEAAFGGGGLYDWGSHFIDQLWRLLLPARPVTVFAQLRGNVWTSDCDDFARICINFDSGAVGIVEINTTTLRPMPRWHIDGTAGSADSPFSQKFDTREWARLAFVDKSGTRGDLPIAAGGMDNAAIWDRFARACRGDGPPAVTVESVIPTMRLLDAARESSQKGGAVTLDPSISWVE